MIASLEGVVTRIRPRLASVAQGRRRGLSRVTAGRARWPGLTVGKPTLKLHTHHLVREDLQALYGFRTAEELGFFELLITVTGVGPKVGLAIVSSRPWPTCSWPSSQATRPS